MKVANNVVKKPAPAGRPHSNKPPEDSFGKYLPAAWIALGVVVVSAAFIFFARRLNEQPPPAPAPPPMVKRIVPPAERPPNRLKRQQTTPAVREVNLWDASSSQPSVPVRKPVAPPSLQSTRATGSSALAQQYMTRLSQIDISQGALTRDQARELNQLLKQLVDQGDAAVPAIRDFLARNEDINFDKLQGGEWTDYASARLGLIDALAQIGGPEAIAVAYQTLQSTADPLELALLTRSLEQLAPAHYREQELAAAREALALAASGQWDGRDVSPLFELLQRYGDATIVADLERAVAQWNYYATLGLAGLPDGAGIPTLIKLAQDPNVSGVGIGDFALRPLAQVALQYPDARNALIDEARRNQIPDSAWPTVAATVGGAYIQYGNQIFGSTAGSVNWSADQVQQRIALVDQLLSATSSATGRQALQTVRTSLVSRLTR